MKTKINKKAITQPLKVPQRKPHSKMSDEELEVKVNQALSKLHMGSIPTKSNFTKVDKPKVIGRVDKPTK